MDASEAAQGWDWGKFASAVTALTAVAALLFTALSLQQSRDQNQLAESGQITDRFNAAVTNLGSTTETIRVGGIYALQRIMTDSPRDQPAAIQVVAAFVREHAPLAAAVAAMNAGALKMPAIDVQTALVVLGTRNPSHDQGAVIDLDNTDLILADLARTDFDGANLRGAILTSADLRGANLRGANLEGANLTYAGLTGADLTFADLRSADLRGPYLNGAKLNGAALSGPSWCAGTKPVQLGGYSCVLL